MATSDIINKSETDPIAERHVSKTVGLFIASLILELIVVFETLAIAKYSILTVFIGAVLINDSLRL